MALNQDTGDIVWKNEGFKNSYSTPIMANVGGEEQLITFMATATPEEFVLLSEVALLDKVAWTVPTVVGKHLYVRDKTTIRALDLG